MVFLNVVLNCEMYFEYYSLKSVLIPPPFFEVEDRIVQI